MKCITRFVVSLAIKIEARILACRAFGSVRGWRDDCNQKNDPTERNRLVINMICDVYPEFRARVI